MANGMYIFTSLNMYTESKPTRYKHIRKLRLVMLQLMRIHGDDRSEWNTGKRTRKSRFEVLKRCLKEKKDQGICKRREDTGVGKKNYLLY